MALNLDWLYRLEEKEQKEFLDECAQALEKEYGDFSEIERVYYFLLKEKLTPKELTVFVDFIPMSKYDWLSEALVDGGDVVYKEDGFDWNQPFFCVSDSEWSLDSGTTCFFDSSSSDIWIYSAYENLAIK